MKLYTFPGAPNPRRVAIFMSEKGIDIPTVNVDLMKQEQLEPAFRAKNPNCDVPALELDDGTCLSQVNAVCRYLEAIYPENPLYGTRPEQIAQIEMWNHLCFFNGLHSVAEVLRNSPKWPEGRALTGPYDYRKIPELMARGKQRVSDFFSDIDNHLADSEYFVGGEFSMADITALAAVDFTKWVRIEIPDTHQHLLRWYALVSERPSVKANTRN